MKNVRASHPVRTLTRRGRRCAVLAATLTALIVLSGHVASTSAAGQAAGQQGQTLVAEREIAMKITAPFTLAAVGDLIMRNPAGRLAEPAFTNLMKPLQSADVTFANMEGNLLDFDSFQDPTFEAAPIAALADIKAMGVDIMSTANNHSLGNGIPGMLETIRSLNAVASCTRERGGISRRREQPDS